MRAIKKVGMFDSKETIAAKIPVAEMVIDDYQGHVNRKLVDKLAKKWNDSAAGAIILNLRDDMTYAVLDGQHRVLAARQVGVTDLNALVFIGKTKEEEAGLFVMLNEKHNVSSLDRFRANLVAGMLREKNIRHALREVGLDINFAGGRQTKNADAIQCVAALTNIYDKFGLAHVKSTLGVLTSAFHDYPDRRKTYSQPSVIGTAQFLYRYPQADVSRLIAKLRSKSPTVLVAMGEAKLDAHSDLWTGWGKMLVDLYNGGLKAKDSLPKEPMARKIFSPGARERIKGVAKRTYQNLTEEQRAAQRERLHKASLASAAKRRAAVEARRLDMTINNPKPLTGSFAAAAKTSKKKNG